MGERSRSGLRGGVAQGRGRRVQGRTPGSIGQLCVSAQAAQYGCHTRLNITTNATRQGPDLMLAGPWRQKAASRPPRLTGDSRLSSANMVATAVCTQRGWARPSEQEQLGAWTRVLELKPGWLLGCLAGAVLAYACPAVGTSHTWPFCWAWLCAVWCSSLDKLHSRAGRADARVMSVARLTFTPAPAHAHERVEPRRQRERSAPRRHPAGCPAPAL